MMAAFGVIVSFCSLGMAFLFGVALGTYDEAAIDRADHKAAGWFFLCLAVLLWIAGLCMVQH